MRTIKGEIALPDNAPKAVAEMVLIEVRDVSVQDAPSVVIAQQELKKVKIAPNKKIDFKISVPEAEAHRSLSLRVHVSIDGSGNAQSGDLLTVQNYQVSSVGTQDEMNISVALI